MNYLDLFSGIGGFSLAMQRVGIDFDNHYASEIDKYARSIYARQFPESVQLGDVTKIGDELGKIDFITGGFPCQTFSIAGARRGFEDTRGTLFFDIARLADIYKPRYMVLENVKGLLNHDRGNTVRVILDKLRGLDYHVQMLLLNTKDFDVPQNRERVFFICSLAGERRPEVFRVRERKTEIVGCNEMTFGQSQGYRVYNPAANSVCLASQAGGVGAKTGLYAVSTRNKTPEFHSELCPCQTATQYKDPHKVAIPCLSPDRVEKRQNGRRFKEDGDPMFTLTAQDRHGVLSNYGIRRLTPIECERLQDFPDDWTKYGENNELISDSQRYKTLGNAVTVRVVEAIMQSIKDVL